MCCSSAAVRGKVLRKALRRLRGRLCGGESSSVGRALPMYGLLEKESQICCVPCLLALAEHENKHEHEIFIRKTESPS